MIGRRTRQPQVAVRLNANNPLANLPSFVVLPSVGREVAFNTGITPSGTTPPTKTQFSGNLNQGVAYQFAGGVNTGSYLDLGTPVAGSSLGNGTPCTFVAVFTSTATANVMLAERNDANAVDVGWVFGYIRDGSGNLGLGFIKEFSGNNCTKTITNAISTTGPNVLVVTYDGSLNAAGINVYLNGVLGTVGVATSGGGSTSTDVAQNLYIGRSTFYNSQSHTGGISLVGAFNRIWSPAEVYSFSQNPWQIFEEPNKLFVGAPQSTTPDQPPSQIYFADDVDAYEPNDYTDLAAYDFYTDTTANRADIQPPIPVELPQSFEWIDPNETEEALWPDYWSQAPPIADDLPQQGLYEDGQYYDVEEEDFAFFDAPFVIAVVVTDQIYPEDASLQLEEDEFLEGFFDAPASTDDLPIQGIYEDGSGTDPEDENYGFLDAQVPADDLPQQGIYEDGSSQELEEEDFGYLDAPQSADLVITVDQIYLECSDNQLEDSDEDYGFGTDPTPADVIAVQVDQIYPELGNEFQEDPDEDFGFADQYNYVPAILSSRSTDSNADLEYEDEDYGFNDSPISADALVIADQIYPELGDTQGEELEENFEFNGDFLPSQLNVTLSAGGGYVFSGTAPFIRTKVFSAGGTLVFSGSAPQIKTKIFSAGGLLLFSGSAPISFIPAGGVASTLINRLNVRISRALGL